MARTVDILDFLKPEYEKFMDLSDTVHKKLSERTVTISPRFWNRYGQIFQAYELSLEWTEVRYSDLKNHLEGNPDSANFTGIYFFVVKPNFLIESLPGFVFYVGIAGETTAGRSLRKRLRDYLNPSQLKKRDRIFNALQYYYEFTYVNYARIDADPEILSGIEEALHGYFYPWASTRDFPAAIKKAQKSWGNV